MTERRPATDLYLIRHGESHANIDGVISAMATDRGLTERGLAQVRALAARLETGEIPADALYASTLPRARMTAEIVAAALDLPVEWNDDLHELRLGEAEGLHVGEVRERFPQVARFIGEPFTPLAPGGESWGGFQARVSATLEEIVRRHAGQRIVVVAHGGVIEVACLYFLGLGPDARARLGFPAHNTAITHWRHSESFTGRREWQFIAHNDHRHLVGLGV